MNRGVRGGGGWRLVNGGGGRTPGILAPADESALCLGVCHRNVAPVAARSGRGPGVHIYRTLLRKVPDRPGHPVPTLVDLDHRVVVAR